MTAGKPDLCGKCGVHGKLISNVTGLPLRQAKPRTATMLPVLGGPSSPRFKPNGRTVIGIDPGGTYTALLCRDGDSVVFSTCLERPDNMTFVAWGQHCADEAVRIRTMLDPAGAMPMGIEGVNTPGGFSNGKKQLIDPRGIIMTAVVLGALAREFRQAVIVPPGGNGSGHPLQYPPELTGRRTVAMPGSGPRDHEKSAYDIAGKAALLVRAAAPRKKLSIS